MANSTFTLPPLPFAEDALAPHISKETISFHYGKHHQGYVNKLNAALEGSDDAKKTLEQLIKSAGGKVFNCAAQTWNHTFYWNSMSPNGGGEPTGAIKEAIEKDFGSFDAFKQEFTTTAATHFGSGWAWLVKNGEGKLEVVGTHDAGNPLTDGKTPILMCGNMHITLTTVMLVLHTLMHGGSWSTENRDILIGNNAYYD